MYRFFTLSVSPASFFSGCFHFIILLLHRRCHLLYFISILFLIIRKNEIKYSVQFMSLFLYLTKASKGLTELITCLFV